MTASPKVSVLIPTFNRKELLSRAIEAALSQTVSSEVIVIDHGSSDGTPEMMKNFADRVTYVRREDDMGVIAAWLDGLLHCNSDLVKILFDDDGFESTFIEEALLLLRDDVGFVFSEVSVRDIKTNREVGHMFDFRGVGSGVYSNKSRFGKVVAKTMISPSAMLLRRSEALEAIFFGKLPLQHHEFRGAGPDHLMKLLSMLRYPMFGYIASPLVTFGHHSESITVNALAEDDSRKRLKRTYREVEDYYRMLLFWQSTTSFRLFIRSVVRQFRRLGREK